MKYQAIIFDMDGTIIDSESIWSKVIDTILYRHNINLSPDMNKDLKQRMLGAGIIDCCHLLKKTYDIGDSAEKLMEEKITLATQLYKEHIAYMRGFTTFIQKVKTYNLKIAIATNADATTVLIANQKLKLDAYFGDHIYHIAHVNNRGKPHPDIYLHAARNINIDPKYCIAIEDSAHGIQAAIKAGMFCIGFNSSRHSQQVKNSHLIVQEYDEINLDNILF